MAAAKGGTQRPRQKPSRSKLDITEHYVYLPQGSAPFGLLQDSVGARPSAPWGLPLKDWINFIEAKTAVKEEVYPSSTAVKHRFQGK